MLTDARGSTNHRPPYPPAYPYKPAPSPPAPRTRCCCCPAKLSTSACTCLGVCVLVLGYTLLGAFTFMALEGGFSQQPPPKNPQTLSADMRSRTVERLWSITEDLNILYKDNWTRLAAQEVLKFQDTLVQSMRGKTGGGSSGAPTHYNQQHRWSFASSFLYSLTLITTIGYGSVAPRSAWGRAVTVLYALLGIPLMLVYLSTVGEVLARSFRRLYSRMRCKQQPPRKKPSDAHAHCNNVGHFNSSESDDLSKAEHGSNLMILDCGSESIAAGGQATIPPKHGLPEVIRVPISLCLTMVVLYICGGALLFNRLENWTFLEGSFFCFTSLGTIGFGDMVPGHYHSNQNSQYQTSSGLNPLEQISIFVTSAYILVGMAIIAMCFNLVQDEVVVLVRKFGKYFGVSNGAYHRGDDEQGMIDEGEGIAMAVVGAGNTS